MSFYSYTYYELPNKGNKNRIQHFLNSLKIVKEKYMDRKQGKQGEKFIYAIYIYIYISPWYM